MKNVLYIPLDERPCNANFVPLIAKGTEYNLITPYEAISGNKKVPANIDEIWAWMFHNIDKFDIAILSIDMLIYGGIVPSRLHYIPLEKSIERLDNLRKLKKIKPTLKIFAFNLIMRCPSYSNSDEEPDYYEDYGSKIFMHGVLTHKTTLNLINKDEEDELAQIKKLLPIDTLNDYISRRKLNMKINKATIDLVNENVLDFLVIPQDDSAPYGFTSIDQQELREYIHTNRLDFKVYMYPGADEVGLTLFARLINMDKNLKPCVYTRFSSTKGPFIIPLYEDRMLFETIKYHILCAGGIPVDSMACADIVLMVNSPAEKMYEAWEQNNPNAAHNLNKNLVEFIEYMDYVINVKKLPCALADVNYSNGGDLELIDNLANKDLLFKVASYAGWNTNANTLGTTICQSLIYNIYGKTKDHLNFLALRYVEDVGYCSYVRKFITDSFLPQLNMSYFMVDGKNGKVATMVQKELQNFADERLTDTKYGINILNNYMPWSRMFEVGIEAETFLK